MITALLLISVFLTGQVAFAQETSGDASGSVRYEGIVAPLRTADIAPIRDGQILEYTFEPGDYVKEGDLLVKLNTIEEKAALRLATAGLARAKAQLQLADAKLARAQTLFEREVVSEAELDAAKAERAIAAADREAAQAQVDTRNELIEWFSLHAPFDGMTSALLVNEGAYITRNARSDSALLTVTQLDPIRVTGMVPYEVYAARRTDLPTDEAAKQGLTLELILPDGSEYPHPGELVGGGQAFDETTQTVPISAVFPNPDRLLRPGLRVTVVSTLRDAPAGNETSDDND